MDKITDPILMRFQTARMAHTSSASFCSVLAYAKKRDRIPITTLPYFYNQYESFWAETGRIADIDTDILFETGATINAMPMRATRHRKIGRP